MCHKKKARLPHVSRLSRSAYGHLRPLNYQLQILGTLRVSAVN